MQLAKVFLLYRFRFLWPLYRLRSKYIWQPFRQTLLIRNKRLENAVGAKRRTFLMHQESKCHKDGLLKSSNFMQIAAGQEKNIKCSISKSYEDNIKKNQEIILNIIDVIVVMGQRNIPFRGHNWDKITKREDGNFDFLVHWKAEDKPVTRRISKQFSACYFGYY